MTAGSLAERIQEQALQCGFDRCGIVPLSALDGFLELLQKRIDAVPEAAGFYRSFAENDARRRFPWAKAVVVLVFDYGRFRYPKALQGKYGKAFFLDPPKGCRAGFDLGKLEEWFRENGIRADGGNHYGATSVGPLRYLAMKAGLGIVRKNNFFYTEKGSYNNLYAYVIDQECELIEPCNLKPCAPSCDLCRKACRTKALQASYEMNPAKCVSFLTTFGNCEVPEGLTDEQYEQWLCGCDNCQDACPYNRRHDWSQGVELEALEELAPRIQPENYPNLTDEFLLQNVIPRTSRHLQERDIPALRKNAARAAQNS